MSRQLLVLSALAPIVVAQTFMPSNPAALAARQWREHRERSILGEFVQLLAIPNIASDRANIRRNAETIAKMIEKRGIAAKLVSVPGGNPVVFGEMKAPGATRTIVLYAHYDGQPLDPKEWATPPFEPTLREKQLDANGKVIRLPPPGIRFNPEWRLYARSAGDDKLPIVAMVTAIDAMRDAGLRAKSNIKFAFEGEEEAGSANLDKILAMNKELFSGDLWLICDSPIHPSRRQQVVFGAPGAIQFDITVYGPRNELHGGHYGNWAPNPALMLARLLASIKDDEGKVQIEHFYDGLDPLTDIEKRAVEEVPDIDAELMREFWLGSTVGAPIKLAGLITLPVLNIRGMASARVGAQASSVVPATATASISVYPMKGMDHRRIQDAVVAHVRKMGFFVTAEEPSAQVRMANAKVARVAVRPGAYNGTRTPMDLPISREVIRAVESARGSVVKLPAMGGALPLEKIERTLGTRTIVIPTANHDDNQHAANENVRIQNLWDAIELMAALLTM